MSCESSLAGMKIFPGRSFFILRVLIFQGAFIVKAERRGDGFLSSAADVSEIRHASERLKNIWIGIEGDKKAIGVGIKSPMM